MNVLGDLYVIYVHVDKKWFYLTLLLRYDRERTVLYLAKEMFMATVVSMYRP